MTEVISAKLKALSAVLATTQKRQEERLDETFWTNLINMAWQGKDLVDRRAHQNGILSVVNDAVRKHQDGTL